MPWEDSPQSEADISGDLPEVSVRSLPEQRADLQRQQRYRPAPKASSGQIDRPEEAERASASDASDGQPTPKTGGQKTSTQSTAPAPQPQAHNPFMPGLDWSKMDVGQAWHLGQKVADGIGAFLEAPVAPLIDPTRREQASQAYGYASDVLGAAFDQRALSQSIRNIYERNSATKQLLDFLALTGPFSVFTAGERLMGASPEEATTGSLSMGLEAGANPITYAAPESKAVAAGIFVAPLLAQALYSPDPNERAHALTWAGVTAGLLNIDQLRAFRPLLSDALGKWPELENVLDAIVERFSKGQTRIQDPNTDHVKQWLDQVLAQPKFEGGRTKVASGAKQGEWERVNAYRDPQTGQVKIMESEREKAQRAAFKRLGISDADELRARAAAHELTPAQSQQVLDDYERLGLPEDLYVVTPGDLPYRNPATTLKQTTDAETLTRGAEALTATKHLDDELKAQPWGNSAALIPSVFRSMVGLSRSVNDSEREWVAAMLRLAGHVDGNEIMRALEGDVEAYDRLPVEGKTVVDMTRPLNNGMRLLRASIGQENAVGNYGWRVPKRAPEARGKGGGGATAAFANLPNKHRTLTAGVDESGNLTLTQAYDTVQESNKAVTAKRQSLIDSILNPTAPLDEEVAQHPDVVSARKLWLTDPAEARRMAKEYATQLYPPLEENFWKIIHGGVVGRQANAIHRAQAVQLLKSAKTTKGDQVVHVGGHDPRLDKFFTDKGYKTALRIPGPPVYFHPEFADLVEQMQKHADAYKNNPEWWTKLLDLEGKAVGNIMYFPTAHGMNIAGRALMLASLHPFEFVRYLRGGKALTPAQADELSHQLRKEAVRAGVLPHSRFDTWLPDMYKQMADATGDSFYEMPIDLAGAHPDLRELGKPQYGPIGAIKNYFWRQVSDFGVAAYHIEKRAMMTRGFEEAQATAYAARRANSWAGFVAMEDKNPALHDLGRLLMFAPNWWRTWRELFIPYYRHAGFAYDRKTLAYMAENEARLIAGAAAVWYLTLNGLNYMTSGHGASQNEPQNRFRLEITRPDLVEALQAVHYPGADKINPKTGHGPNGEVLTVENPFARFQTQMAGAAGLTTGHDWHPQDAVDGSTKFLVNRLAPVIDGAASLLNWDIYKAVSTHGAQTAYDSSQPAGTLDPQNLAAAALYMVPGGAEIAQNMQHARTPTQDQGTTDMFGVALPKKFSDPSYWKQVGTATGESLIQQWGLGINPAYVNKPKTQGEPISDRDYMEYQKLKAQHETRMQNLSAQAMGGQMTPQQWLNAYRQEETSYTGSTKALFDYSPGAAEGPLALTSSWEGLYDKATDPKTGQLDQDRLAVLQTQWRQQHSSADYEAVRQQLRANDSKYPMLAVYHKTMDSYRAWQDQWARSQGIDPAELRSEIATYGALYGDRAKSGEYLRTHRNLALYERAKKTEFEHTPSGLMYALFYNPAGVSAYMQTKHLTAQQVESEVEAQTNTEAA